VRASGVLLRDQQLYFLHCQHEIPIAGSCCHCMCPVTLWMQQSVLVLIPELSLLHEAHELVQQTTQNAHLETLIGPLCSLAPHGVLVKDHTSGLQ
jgi:hypothetical protein